MVIEPKDRASGDSDVRDHTVARTKLPLESERKRHQRDTCDVLRKLFAKDIAGPEIPVCQEFCAGSQPEIRTYSAVLTYAEAEATAGTREVGPETV